MITVTVLGILFFLIGLAFVIGLSYAFGKAFYSDRSKKQDPYKNLPPDSDDELVLTRRKHLDAFVGLPSEKVYVTSHDGLKLSARYYHFNDGAPVEILCHGFRSSGLSDFAGIVNMPISMGHNVLLVDQRAHGESEGRVISYGANERFDVARWIEYVNERFGDNTPIILFGISMGAATVILTAEQKLTKNVACAVADCPYSSAKDIIKKVGKSTAAELLARICARICGFSITEPSPERAAAHVTIPVLLIHGDEDSFVPCYMSQRIAQANKDIRLEIIHSDKHARAYFAETERYERVFREFVEDSLRRR